MPDNSPMQQAQSPGLNALDEQAFSTMTEPHRRELQVHCYRMLGSVHDAEDMVQETFLRAWRRRETFEGRAPFRAWLYKIATNVCLDALEKHPRRGLPVSHQEAGQKDAPIPAPIREPVWLEPFPDEWLDDEQTNPEGQVSTRENISLAFIAALHLLPPRQRAVLILRDVLEWQASETAELLEMSVPAVKSALHRARSTLASHDFKTVSPVLLDEAGQVKLDQYVRAWETADVEALLALLTDDATFSMPPIPAWYQGRETIGWLVSRTVFSGEGRGRWRLQTAQANRQVAFGLYKLADDGSTHNAYGIQVLRFRDKDIADITTCINPALFPYFRLPLHIG